MVVLIFSFLCHPSKATKIVLDPLELCKLLFCIINNNGGLGQLLLIHFYMFLQVFNQKEEFNKYSDFKIQLK